MNIMKILLFFTAVSFLFSEEDTSHVIIQQRTLSNERNLKEKRHSEGNPLKKEIRNGVYFERVQYPQFYYPTSCHWLTSLSVLGDSLEIEDGSFWKIASSDERKVLHWSANDPLIITQNTNWFSFYDYKIINKADNSTVLSNLSIGPIVEGEYTHWVVGIDYARREVVLEDYSHWKISGADDDYLDEWVLNDTVIIGVNSGWYSPSYEYILINVNLNEFIRATQY